MSTDLRIESKGQVEQVAQSRGPSWSHNSAWAASHQHGCLLEVASTWTPARNITRGNFSTLPSSAICTGRDPVMKIQARIGSKIILA
eukprot:1159501-Pelagomonas_calceolata.AAC.7